MPKLGGFIGFAAGIDAIARRAHKLICENDFPSFSDDHQTFADYVQQFNACQTCKWCGGILNPPLA
jgi:hypothetical protein